MTLVFAVEVNLEIYAFDLGHLTYTSGRTKIAENRHKVKRNPTSRRSRSSNLPTLLLSRFCATASGRTVDWPLAGRPARPTRRWIGDARALLHTHFTPRISIKTLAKAQEEAWRGVARRDQQRRIVSNSCRLAAGRRRGRAGRQAPRVPGRGPRTRDVEA